MLGILLGLWLAALGFGSAWSQGPTPFPTPAIRNPTTLAASAVLGRREPGVAARVRFQWDAVPGATEYRLAGAWTEPTTWTFRTLEFRVIRATALEWSRQRIAVEFTLPPGAHSWKVVAVFGPNAIGDFAQPTRVSFDLD